MIAVAKRAFAHGLVLVAIASATACRHEEKHAPEVVAVESPVPPPEDLLAEGIVSTPQTTWQRVQRGVGGALGIMPSTIGGLVCALSGIDPTLGPEIAGVSPVHFVVAGDPASPAFAIAVKLVDARRARIFLVESETAKYVAHDAGGMTELTPRDPHSPMALAISPGGMLVMARTTADLEKLGPYAYRTIPSRALPASAVQIDLPGTALRGAIRDRLASSWKAIEAEKLAQDDSLRAQHGGRAPDFGDPRALMTSVDASLEARLAVLGDLKNARVVIDATDDALRADATFTPNDGDGPARAMLNAIHPGDLAPLLASPMATPLAFSMRDDAATRASDGAAIEAALAKTFGARLTATDAKKLHAATSDWEKGRGDWVTAALAWDDPRGVIVRAAAANGELASRGVHEGLELTRAPFLHDPLHAMLRLGDVTFAPIDLPAADGAPAKGELATGTLGSGALSKGGAAPNGSQATAGKIGVAWGSTGSGVRIALAEDPVALLRRTPARTLADEPAITRATAPIASDASFVVIAQLSRFDPTRASAPSAPFVFAWGKRGDSAWAHVDLADVLIRDYAKSRMGL